MFAFPKIEKITFDVSVSHFLLMFGYKLFSLYFPLFLIARGLSLPQVGYTYLLIYLPIAIFAPIAGFLSGKINPAILSAFGTFGYGFYCLEMILINPTQSPFLFFQAQIFLGISAALFFVSTRKILISSKLENHNRAFAWFYSSPYYADAIAPAVGALVIWQFDFYGIFLLSLILQFLNAIFCLTSLDRRQHSEMPPSENSSVISAHSPVIPAEAGIYDRYNKYDIVDSRLRGNDKEKNGNNKKDNDDNRKKLSHIFKKYQKAFKKIKERNIFILLFVSFSVLILAGFYRAFFVLFLKDLNWSQNLILFFVSLISLIFIPISLFLIKKIGKIESRENIFQGVAITGIFSIILGGLGAFSNFSTIFAAKFGQSIGGLMAGSGRSGFLSKKLKEYPEQASAIDTIFSPLGIAIGSLISGLIIGLLGFNNLFIFGGIFVIITAIIGKILWRQNNAKN
jgi:MFS family permease